MVVYQLVKDSQAELEVLANSPDVATTIIRRQAPLSSQAPLSTISAGRTVGTAGASGRMKYRMRGTLGDKRHDIAKSAVVLHTRRSASSSSLTHRAAPRRTAATRSGSTALLSPSSLASSLYKVGSLEHVTRDLAEWSTDYSYHWTNSAAAAAVRKLHAASAPALSKYEQQAHADQLLLFRREHQAQAVGAQTDALHPEHQARTAGFSRQRHTSSAPQCAQHARQRHSANATAPQCQRHIASTATSEQPALSALEVVPAAGRDGAMAAQDRAEMEAEVDADLEAEIGSSSQAADGATSGAMGASSLTLIIPHPHPSPTLHPATTLIIHPRPSP